MSKYSNNQEGLSVRYKVVDIETTIKNRGELAVGEEQASPFDKSNRAVMIGTYSPEENYKLYAGREVGGMAPSDLYTFNVLVGQNIRFDLMYLLKTYPWFEEWLHDPNNQIWDTQLAEYLLTGQQHKWASLDQLSEKYGGSQKEDKIKEYWENGIDTEDIPAGELADYLRDDVMNTHLVFIKQLDKARQMEMLPLIRTQMRSLVATCEMWKNGMSFNKTKALTTKTKLEMEFEGYEGFLTQTFAEHFPKMKLKDIKPGSNQLLSKVLFGGTYKYKEPEPCLDEEGNVIHYKSGKRKGQAKTKLVEKQENLPPWIPADTEWETKTAGIYQVGDEVLKQIATNIDSSHGAVQLIKQVQKYREYEKDISTYFSGYSDLAWFDQDQDTSFIHGNLTHCNTDTGRLSSSKPNLQNLSGKEREQ